MEEGYDINENKSKIKNFENKIINNENSTDITHFLNINNINNINTKTYNNISFNTIRYNKKGNEILIKGKYFLIKKRKRKLGQNTKHTNRSYDNMSRKIKSWVILDLIKFINKKFEEKEKNIKKKDKTKLYIINNTQAYNTTINYNKQLLKKKVFEVLSEKVSLKVKIDKEHNKNIIKKVFDNNKYNDIIEIFNLDFLDCINHFFGNTIIESLKGFEKGYEEKEKSISNYKERFECLVNNYEQYYSDKDFRIEMNKKK